MSEWVWDTEALTWRADAPMLFPDGHQPPGDFSGLPPYWSYIGGIVEWTTFAEFYANGPFGGPAAGQTEHDPNMKAYLPPSGSQDMLVWPMAWTLGGESEPVAEGSPDLLFSALGLGEEPPPPDPEPPATPDFFRHSSRHIHNTVANHIEAGLAALSWTDPDASPLGAPVLSFRRTPAFAGEQVATGVVVGTVAISPGSEVDPDPQELGGPLHLLELPFFVDVFMDNHTHAGAVIEDVRDLLRGRFPDLGSRFIPVVDQVTGTARPGWKIEFTDIEIRTPDTVTALAWKVLKVTASTYFPEVNP